MPSAAAPGPEDRLFPPGTRIALVGIAAVLAVQFAWVRPTNFGGFDEWVILSLVARGIVDVPYANRPFELLWSLPAALGPPSLWTYYVMHMAYLAGSGCLVFLLWRRLSPELSPVAFLTGVLAATWAPLDYQRLNVVQPYAGYTFMAQLAILLLVESWIRRRPVLLWLGALLAFVNVRAYEASGALLLGAPLYLLWAKTRPSRPWAWVAAWEAVVLFAISLAALPLLLPARGLSYQQQLLGGVDLHPLRVVERLAGQYRYHLWPLVTTPLAELAVPAVPIAVATFGLASLLTARRAGAARAGGPSRRRDAAGLMLLGLVLAGLGYAVLVLSSGLVQAARTQFLSTSGIALFLASSFALVASLLPQRWRTVAIGLLGAWVVAVGTSRTIALQRFWDQVSVHADQVRLLGRLVRMAPRLQPNTFVILVDEAGAFETSAAFRHALVYLYRGEAIGHAWGKWDFGYPARLTSEGILSEPWPVIREAWQAPVTHHRFDEVLVLRQTAGGELLLLDDWPTGLLPPLPPGARYDPRSRIAQGTAPRERRILGWPFLP